jgi:hypothetical protein
MEPSKKRTLIEIIVGVVAVAVFAVLFIAAYQSYQNETDNRTALVAMEAPATGDYVEAYARVLGVDPVKGEMTVRITFTPQGELANAGELKQELALYVNSATGGQNRSFPKGKDMSPIDVTLDLDGIVTDYPFDRHEAFLELYLTEPVKDGDPLAVPIVTNFVGSMPGLKVSAAVNEASAENYNLIDITIERSQAILILVIFAMSLMWLITLTVVFMLLAVVLRGRKVEFGMFAFMAGFLFSFVAFRNAMPGVPPIGTLSDYLAFFWGYALISLSLIGLTITWLSRPAK